MNSLSFVALFIAIGGLCNSITKKESIWIWVWSGVLTYDLYVVILEVVKVIQNS